MGSPSDEEHCTKIAKFGAQLGLKCHLRCTSAHKGTEETLQILAEYEGSKPFPKYLNIDIVLWYFSHIAKYSSLINIQAIVFF